MKIYIRVLHYVLRYWKYLLASVVCMVLFVGFSAFSLGAVMPFINILFGQAPEQAVVKPSTESLKSLDTSGEETALILKKRLPDLRKAIEEYVNRLFSRYPRIEALKILCLVILMGFFLKNLFRVGQAFFMAPVEQGVIEDFRNDLFEHFQKMSLSYFHGERAGQLISRVTNDVTIINASVTAAINSLFRDPLLILIYLAFLVVLSWRLTLIVLILFPVTGWLLTRMGNKLKLDSARMQERLADMTSILQEALYGIRVVKAFAMEHFEIDKFKRQNKTFRDTLVHMARIRNLSPCLTEYVGVMVGVIVLYFGGREVLGTDSSLSPGGFILFLGALFSLMQPLKFLGQVHNSLKEGIVAAQRVFNVLDTPPAIKDNPEAVALERFEDSIRFKNVSFSYNQGMEVLQGVSLVVKKGQVLALVGPSGSGKSTLVDLLVRFYDPTEGSIEIDGQDIRTLTLTSLRNLMGIVTQETILFNDTIWNNIAYGKLETSEEEVIRAAKAANAHEFISKMPMGYQTVIGDRGVKLSGGQRQRLAIARAILKNPPILIFDEATSSLDTQSELLVQEAIERLLAGRTSFVIAHRLSTVQHADHIVVLNNGKIVQQGVHTELIKQEGLYKQLYEMQFRN